jgi:hypothetical protein
MNFYFAGAFQFGDRSNPGSDGGQGSPNMKICGQMFEDGGLQTRRGSDGIRDPSFLRKRL